MKIPEIPNVRVINKEVIIQLSSDFRPTTYLYNPVINKIKNIKFNHIEECIKNILLDNPNTTFDTIQYSTKNNELIVYTNHQIIINNMYNSYYLYSNETKEKYFDKNILYDKDLEYNNKKELDYKIYYNDLKYNKNVNYSKYRDLIQDLDNINNSTPNDNLNYISLYNLHNLLKEKYNTYIEKIQKYKIEICQELNLDISDWALSFIDLKSYYNNKEIYELRVMEKDGYNDMIYTDTLLYRDKNNIIVKDLANEKIDSDLKDKLIEIYKELEQLGYNYEKIEFKPINFNSNTVFSVDYNLIELSNFYNYPKFLKVSFKPNGIKYFDLEDILYKNEINNIHNLLCKKKYKLFNNIYINIKDCPKKYQSELYNLRKNEIINQMKNNNKNIKNMINDTTSNIVNEINNSKVKKYSK